MNIYIGKWNGEGYAPANGGLYFSSEEVEDSTFTDWMEVEVSDEDFFRLKEREETLRYEEGYQFINIYLARDGKYYLDGRDC